MTGGEGSVRSSDERNESAYGNESNESDYGDESNQSDQGDEETVHRAEAPNQQTAGTEEDSLGWRGWVVVAALVVSFIVVPWVIILLPEAQGVLEAIGLGWRDAYLVLPLLPALGLATLAVWAAVASRQ